MKGATTQDLFDENSGEPGGTLIPAPELKADDIARFQSELKDTRSKLQTVTQKFASVKKDRDFLKKQTKELQQSVVLMQSGMREMLPGFSGGSQCPSEAELRGKLGDFMKHRCEDAFFDLLVPELTIEGIVYFFKETFRSTQRTIEGYFEPLTLVLQKSTCSDSIDSPLSSVLSKTYQNNWRKVHSQCFTQPKADSELADRIQTALQLRGQEPKATAEVLDFVRTVEEIMLLCSICDPLLFLRVDTVGEKVSFNATIHEAMDGFVKAGESAVVLLPAVHRGSIQGEMVVRARVLALNYELP